MKSCDINVAYYLLKHCVFVINTAALYGVNSMIVFQSEHRLCLILLLVFWKH